MPHPTRIPSASYRVGPVHVDDWGGPAGADTLVLLHGFTDSGRCWPDAVEQWGGTHRLVTIDARGHGRSDRFTPPELSGWPADLMVEDTIGVLKHLGRQGATPVVIVGHSMGGGIALGVALARPDLVRGLVLEDPALGQATGATDEQRQDWAAGEVAQLRAYRDDPDGIVDIGLRDHPTWPESEFAPWAAAKLETDLYLAAGGRITSRRPWPEQVAGLTVPTLLLTGTDDVIWSVGELRRLREVAPQVHAEVVAGADHCVRRTQPTTFYWLVNRWLAGLSH